MDPEHSLENFNSTLAKGQMVEFTTLNVSVDAISMIILNMILVAVL